MKKNEATKAKKLTKKQAARLLDLLGPLPVPDAQEALHIMGYELCLVKKELSVRKSK